LKAEGATHALPPATLGKETLNCRTLAEMSDSLHQNMASKYSFS